MDLKVSPQTVLSQTVNMLRDAILSGHFKPGERLVEMDLCQRVGVSRTSIREALRRLEAEKLITIIPNKGPSVAVIDWSEAEQIYAVRALLEGEAAALFARRSTSAQVGEMRQALELFSKAVAEDDPIGRVQATARFYDVMLSGCGNSIIHETLLGLTARINFLRARSMSHPGRVKHSLSEMRRMLSGISKKDPTAARAAAVDHVHAACAAARETFESERAAEQIA
jgi:DNA-binding GntR family transcriptional regulator